MQFQFWPAVLAGLIAGAIMEGPVYMQKGIGLNVKQNIFRTWGRLLGLRDSGGYFAGFLFHQVLSAVIALLYAGVFSAIGVTSSFWLWGVLGAVVHYLIAGVVVGALPSVDPDNPLRVGEQGTYYKNYGALDMATFLMGHMSFGLLVGILYGYFTGGLNAAF
jgi:hypothetical protein